MRQRPTLAALAAIVALAAVVVAGFRPEFGPAMAASEPAAGGGAGFFTGSINGTVTEEGTGTPLADICVNADETFGDSGSALTDASGSYTIEELFPGDYTVEFFDCADSPTHAPEFYNDQPWGIGTGDLVAVSEGSKTSGIDAALEIGGSINGTVTAEATGMPLADICVNASEVVSGFSGGSGRTDASGEYSMGGLPTGNYAVQFYECVGLTYLPEFYDDQADFDSADLVAVTIGAKTSGIDAELAISGSISGTVTSEATGMPLADICVLIHNPAYTQLIAFGIGDVSGSSVVGFEETDASGAYIVNGFATGDYKVEFFDCADTVTYAAEFYDDQPDFDSATLVAVVAGSTTSGIDAELSDTSFSSGDANCNGTVDSIDAALVLQFGAGLLSSLDCQGAADVNGDGEITSVDAALILQFSAGLLGSLPPLA